MEASILIVSKNRSTELKKTLGILQKYVNFERHEILVFLDGCTDNSIELIRLFPRIKWEVSNVSLGASKARCLLYKTARGKILFGFDDDSHPLQTDFISITKELFEKYTNLGILSFQEIKGNLEIEDFNESSAAGQNDYITNDFLGCGFAIRKDVYDKTRGFPTWIDIYGEEICLAWETMDLGFDIIYTKKISINHRVDSKTRKKSGANYFRFQKQLKNMTYFYLVYYPYPLVGHRILRLYFKNFFKYALKDVTFFKAYFSGLGEVIKNVSKVLKFRKPVSISNVRKFSSLPSPRY